MLNMVQLQPVILAFLIFSESGNADEVSFTLIVPAGKIECFYHSVTYEHYQSFELDYMVLCFIFVVKGGENDITFYSESPLGNRIITELRVELNDTRNGYGDYKFCFDNSFSIQTAKHIFFDFYLMDSYGQFLGDFNKKFNVEADILRNLDMHIDNFQTVTTSVKNNLNAIERIQRHYSSSEILDRSILERSFEMINFWSFIHLITMLFAASVQV
ncbi:unnamed protein product [Dracunculus medinensis]|uniref:GOLD domain-containing protein n=1 Tax=Dracunculus medinensis TaxID=318479 RepID=A0A0N4U4Y3_DRAME|nr:unnamed protein product [Dracunculus medinensis]